MDINIFEEKVIFEVVFNVDKSNKIVEKVS